MPRFLKLIAALYVFYFGSSNVSFADFMALIPPGATSSTASAVDGANVVGTYETASDDSPQGYYYNGSSYTTLTIPGDPTASVRPTAVSGNIVVGWFYTTNGSDGFIYNGATGAYTILDPLSNQDSLASGVSGNNVVGTTSNNQGGFSDYLFSITTSQYAYITPLLPANAISISSAATPHISGTTIAGSVEVDVSGSVSYLPYVSQGGPGTILPFYGLIPLAVSGDNIVGYNGSNGGQPAAVLLNGSGLTNLNPSGAVYSEAMGVSGNIIVGTFENASGPLQSFIYNGSTFSILAAPDGSAIQVTGVSGSSIVGNGYDGVAGEGDYGFLYSGSMAVPEPSTLVYSVMAIVCACALATMKRIVKQAAFRLETIRSE